MLAYTNIKGRVKILALRKFFLRSFFYLFIGLITPFSSVDANGNAGATDSNYVLMGPKKDLKPAQQMPTPVVTPAPMPVPTSVPMAVPMSIPKERQLEPSCKPKMVQKHAHKHHKHHHKVTKCKKCGGCGTSCGFCAPCLACVKPPLSCRTRACVVVPEPVVPLRRICRDIEFLPCPEFPKRRVSCEIINPEDLVDSTCNEFIKKLQICEAYTCFTPYSLDPTVKTKWQIHGKNGYRCIISNTTEDIGLKDPDGNPLPVTQICEYDKRGLLGLIERFVDEKQRFYHFLTCDRFEGIHNCTFNSRGKNLKEAMHSPTPEIDIVLPPSGG